MAMAACALLLAGCAARNTILAPAPPAIPVPGIPLAAADSEAGVRIIVQAGAWPGDPRIGEAFQPLRVALENRGTRPILITYDKFALLGPRGSRYPALAPFRIRGTREDPEVLRGPDPLPDPLIIAERFELAPGYDGLYPWLPVLDGGMVVDTVLVDTLEANANDAGLPTRAMVRHALPEGVLLPGGVLEGFLFFDRIPSILNGVTFRAQLVGVDRGEVIGTLVIPFKVAPG